MYTLKDIGTILVVLIGFIMVIDHLNGKYQEDYEKHIEQSLKKVEVEDGSKEVNNADH